MTQSEQTFLSGIQQAVDAFAAQAPEELRTAEIMQRDIEQLFQEFDAFETSLSEVEADDRVSEVVKEERRVALRTQFPEALTTRLTAVQKRLAEVEERTRIQPPQLDADPAVAEARLGNARSDARMLLDVAGDKAPDVMRQLVESNSDPALTHLLMFTNWPTLYLQSRGGGNGPARIWEHHRAELLESVLPPEQAGKAKTAKALRHLREAAQIASHARHFALADRGIKP